MRPAWLALALWSCMPAPAPPPSPGCAAACDRLEVCKLGRIETAKGEPCFAVCENAVANGIDFGVACLASAPSCEAARDCN